MYDWKGSKQKSVSSYIRTREENENRKANRKGEVKVEGRDK